ncbi:hypothetical protein LRP50_25340 [Enterovibrio sp. ZSDZ42]|uniref:Uncharacterized protein n=1 Tax=Enterovibrio gelatinilyticus TaxID=2899819 RepID=A0ABT5R854_9GAMM|nr:hypothetical protein [Enterovibrio sp. ZSDZ42]MDD1796443.1 hypothetical protein [Enterovibrio sp. ZSDZ42]
MSDHCVGDVINAGTIRCLSPFPHSIIRPNLAQRATFRPNHKQSLAFITRFVARQNLEYLDLLVEVTSKFGTVLFKEQSGARYTINLQQPENIEKVEDNLYLVEQFKEDDGQLTHRKALESALLPIRNPEESS